MGDKTKGNRTEQTGNAAQALKKTNGKKMPALHGSRLRDWMPWITIVMSLFLVRQAHTYYSGGCMWIDSGAQFWFFTKYNLDCVGIWTPPGIVKTSLKALFGIAIFANPINVELYQLLKPKLYSWWTSGSADV